MKRILFLVVVVAAFVLVANQALAAEILSLLNPNGTNQASDENREYLIDRVIPNTTIQAGTYVEFGLTATAYRQLWIADDRAALSGVTFGTTTIDANGNGIIEPATETFNTATIAAAATIPAYGQIDPGDAFRGSININTLNAGSANVGGTTGNNELSGVIQIRITAVVPGPDLNGDGIPDSWTFGFAPDPAFAGTTVGGHVVEAGAIAVVFEDTVPDYAGDFNDPLPAARPPADNDGDLTNGPFDDGTPATRTVPPSFADVSSGLLVTEEAFVATSADDTWRLTLGFLGLPGEGAFGLGLAGTNNILQAFSFTSGSGFVDTNLGLNVIAMEAGWDAVMNIVRNRPSVFGGFVDFAVSQQSRGVSDLDTPFEFATNTNMSFFTQIPEPATMLLLGTGLVALAGAARRRMKK